MKIYINKAGFGIHRIVTAALFFSLLLLVQACKRELPLSYQVQTRNVLMFDMLKQDTSMSITVAALQRAGLDGALNSYGPYTFFAPDNNAFRKYFKNHGKDSLSQFTDSAIRTIMIYHILPVRLKAEDFVQGPQSTPTTAGDYISLDISKGYKTNAVANGVATIYQTNIQFYNGYVHKMDAVLDPPVFTIGQFLQNNADQYSIFIGGLKRAGLMDTLTNLTGTAGARTRLTLFAETNAVLKEAGVTTFDNISLDSVTRLMRNHIITGNNFSSSYTHHTTPAIPSLGIIDRWDSTITTLDGQDWIYFDLAAYRLIDSTTNFAASDIILRNGVMHNVSNPLSFPATKKRTQIVHQFWSATNYCYGIPGFSNTVQPTANASSGNWRYYYDGTVITTDKTVVNNLTFMNPDGINDSLVTTVKNIRKGKYKIEVNAKGGARGTYQLYSGQDAIGIPVNYGFPGLATYRQRAVIGTYEFKRSGDTRLNFVCTVVGGINLECLVLTPVN